MPTCRTHVKMDNNVCRGLGRGRPCPVHAGLVLALYLACILGVCEAQKEVAVLRWLLVIFGVCCM